jgi:hypothetical protein
VPLAQGSPPIGESVQAGEWIGRVGVAGNDPPENQVHWEIFTSSLKVVEKLDRNRIWNKVSGRDDQRFCSNLEILNMLDVKPADGIVSTDELLEAYQSNDAYRQAARRMVAEHYSEFSDQPDWRPALAASPEFLNHRSEAQRLFEHQILPSLWLTGDLASRLRMPGDRIFHFFHPVTFLRWVNQILKAAEAIRAIPRAATKDDYASASRGGMVDFDDKKGLAALSKEDTQGGSKAQPELRDLLDGYGD